MSRGTCMVVNGHLTEIVERRNVSATLDGYAADDGLEPQVLHPQTIVSMNLWGFQPSIFRSCMRSSTSTTSQGEGDSALDVRRPDLHHTPLRFDVMKTPSRCIGVTHAEDLPLAQILVREEIERANVPNSRSFPSPAVLNARVLSAPEANPLLISRVFTTTRRTKGASSTFGSTSRRGGRMPSMDSRVRSRHG